jgi:hypothetical protein
LTLQQIARGLDELALVIGNDLKVPPPATGLTEAEWAYVKGIGSGEILRLRDRLTRTLEAVHERD